MTTKVVIVEDEDLYRDMLRVSLSHQPRIRVSATFREPGPALVSKEVATADVALLDVALSSEMNGFELGLRLRRARPDIGIVLLSNYREKAFIAAFRQRKLIGWSYLMKRSIADVATLARAIRGTARGLNVLDPGLVRELKPRPGTRLSRLTERQLDVVTLIAQGHSNEAIANQLGVKKKSVENIINEIYSRLDIQSNGRIHPRVATVLCYLAETHMVGKLPAPVTWQREANLSGRLSAVD